MKPQQVTGIILLLLYSNNAFASDNGNSEGREEEVTSSLVMNDDAAIDLLHRQTEMIYQLNLPKCLDEMKASAPNIRQQFDDKDFAVVAQPISKCSKTKAKAIDCLIAFDTQLETALL